MYREWISINQQLPENNKKYIIRDLDKKEIIAKYSNNFGKLRWITNDGYIDSNEVRAYSEIIEF